MQINSEFMSDPSLKQREERESNEDYKRNFYAVILGKGNKHNCSEFMLVSDK